MHAHTLHAAREVLQQHWGYDTFRPGQKAILGALFQGHDVLGVLPTGGGKSICYQVPALMSEGLVLVISPLIALMHDQVEQLQDRGIAAAYLDSTLGYREVEQRLTDSEHGRYDLLYVAPERLDTRLFSARLDYLNISLLAVDEAHCVSEWGHHFRPAYRQIGDARDAMGTPPVLAVTATATPDVRRDVIEQLQLRDARAVVHGFDRPNLTWTVFQDANKRRRVRAVLNGVPGTSLIYGNTRRSVEEWAQWLQHEGISAEPYHAGLSARQRGAVQHRWISNETRVVVATNAFGMGIDKPDVRSVIHVEMPSSVESYYQEAGRAGRDGERAHAVLLYHPNDVETQEALIESSHPTASETRRVYDAACSIGQIPVGTMPDDPVPISMEAMQRVTSFAPGKIRTAMELLERQEAWKRLPIRKHTGRVRFLQTPRALRQFADQSSSEVVRSFVYTLLRTVHADAFRDWWPLDVRRLVRRSSLSRARVMNGLDFLAERGLLRWNRPSTAGQIQLLAPRAQQWPVDDATVRAARKRAEARLRYMQRYATAVTCRRHFLLTYFGEAHSERCGQCDVCLGRHRPEAVRPSDESALQQMLRYVADDRPRTAWDDLPAAHRTDELLRWLLTEDYLDLDDPLEGRYVLTEKAKLYMK